jgi:RNA polymerase sigma-70 factor (sigma-E family)
VGDDDRITPHDADQLADCFAAHAREIFGHACALARGDRAIADDLVQAAFEAAARAWPELRHLADDQRRSCLRQTVADIGVNGFRDGDASRDQLMRVEVCDPKTAAGPTGQAFAAITLERCWQVIGALPDQQHAIALMRWPLGMKEAEIAAVLGVAETTVSAALQRVRPKLIAQLPPDHPVTGGGTGGSPEDAVPARLYQEAIQAQEPRFAAGYELQTGLVRYRAWLREHGDVRPEDSLAATERGDWNAERALVELYSLHYRPLVRLAAMLVRDTPSAEEVVQEAFIAMHEGWHRLKDTEKALAYLRHAVVNRARSVLRHRAVVEKNAPKPAPDMPSAEHGAMALFERSEVIAALRALPERQREALVLRYYADLSEADIAAAMGISRGAVKSHTARGMAAMRAALERDS